MSRQNRTRHASNFAQSESGAMIVLGLIFFVLMLFAASLAIDVARYEQERVRAQGVADRAVLAAANVRGAADGGLTARDYVTGYFTAEGFTPENIEQWSLVTGDGVTGRSVEIAPTGRVNTMMMSWLGVRDLPLAAPARAEVGAPLPLEVVMVLDISWSMTAMTSNGRTRIENLRDAAAAMVRDLMEDRQEGEIAITLVPYETWVVPPPGLLDHMTNLSGPLQTADGRSQLCADFDDWADLRAMMQTPLVMMGDYENTAQTSPTQGILAGLTAQPAGSLELHHLVTAMRNSTEAQMTRAHCGPMYGFRVTRPLMTNMDEIIHHIEALQPMGSTSIDLGVRYGAMFFDDALRPFVADRISNNEISATMMNRPAGAPDPNDPDPVLRMMIIMTDGENCCGARAQPAVMDENTIAVCDNLKAENVTVYSVAFEAPPRGHDLMQACASSASHFYNTNGAGLTDTFQAIGRQINAASLRLTR